MNGSGPLSGIMIRRERTGTTVRTIVAGELDLASAPDLRECIYGQLADHAEFVVLDLAEVSFIDSSGLHVLLDAVNQDGSRLRIIPSAACLRLFDIAGVRDLLPLIDAETSG
jgi:anti-sigma B factor antagonist